MTARARKDLEVLGLQSQPPKPYFEIDFGDWIEIRAEDLSHRPRQLPRISEARPVFYWIEYDRENDDWAVMQYTINGEDAIAHLDTAFRAREYMLRLRKEDKIRRAWVTRQTPNPELRPIYGPPYRCYCGAKFDTFEEIRDHRH